MKEKEPSLLKRTERLRMKAIPLRCNGYFVPSYSSVSIIFCTRVRRRKRVERMLKWIETSVAANTISHRKCIEFEPNVDLHQSRSSFCCEEEKYALFEYDKKLLGGFNALPTSHLPK